MSVHKRPPTLTDVAKLAGVSVPTASRALNGGVRGQHSGSPELRERVRSAARTLGYTTDLAAQTTKGGRARSVALVVSDIDDPGAATITAGVAHAAEKRGLSVAVRATAGDPDRELQLLLKLRGERHLAIIVATSRTSNTEREAEFSAGLQTLADHGAHIALIGDNTLPFPTISADTYSAARTFAAGLVGAGHTRFAIVSAPEAETTAHDRTAGFLAGLADRNIDVPQHRIVHRVFSRDGGYAAIDELVNSLGQLDVIATMSDAMATGAIARLRELGYPVPETVEVTGFDHLPVLADLIPEFSSVHMPLADFGEAALALVLDASAPPEPGTRIILPAVPFVHGAALV